MCSGLRLRVLVQPRGWPAVWPGSGNVASLLVLRASVHQVPDLWGMHSGWEPLQRRHLCCGLRLAAYWSPWGVQLLISPSPGHERPFVLCRLLEAVMTVLPGVSSCPLPSADPAGAFPPSSSHAPPVGASFLPDWRERF